MAASAESGYAYNDLSGSYSDLCSLSRNAEIHQGSMSVDQEIDVERGLVTSSQQTVYRGSPLDAYFYEEAAWKNRVSNGKFYWAFNWGPGFDEHYTISLDSDCSVWPEDRQGIVYLSIRKVPG